MKKLISILMLVVTTGSVLTFASCKKEKNNVTPTATSQPGNSAALSAFEKETLIYTREEEKMARDVYTSMLSKWNISSFSNISGSEQKHMDAIATLLTAYNLQDPVGNNAAGVFSNTDIQQLYNSLVAKGSISETEAIIAGLTIEDMDIYDLQQAMKQIQKQDIITVYDNLVRASRNHLREFYTQLQNRGGTYTPQYITQQEYNAIVNSPKEHGGN